MQQHFLIFHYFPDFLDNIPIAIILKMIIIDIMSMYIGQICFFNIILTLEIIVLL